MGQERGAKDSRMDRNVHQTWEQERARGRMNTFCPAEPDAYGGRMREGLAVEAHKSPLG